MVRQFQNPNGDKYLSHLASIRRRQATWGKRALGLFVAVWLNLALQPCAMAYSMDVEQPPMQMHEHGGMHGDMDEQMPCADGLADCSIVDDVNHDGRNGQTKLKDAPGDTPTAIAPQEASLAIHVPTDTLLRPRYASVPAGAPPPLHVLYCVYLK